MSESQVKESQSRAALSSPRRGRGVTHMSQNLDV